MLHERWVLAVFFLVGSASLAGTTALATLAREAPADLVISGCQAKKPPVPFRHQLHADKIDVSCNVCHHTQEGLRANVKVEVKKCSSCHLEPEDPDNTPGCSKASARKNSFHIQCVGCHKREREKDAARKVPSKCKQCHRPATP